MEFNYFLTKLENIREEDFKTGCSDNDTFGDALTRFMLEQGIDYKDLAYMIGVSPSTVVRYINGNFIPSMRCLVALVVEMHLSIKKADYLMKLCGYAFNNTLEHSLFYSFICMSYCSEITIEHCNKILLSFGLETLNFNKK